ncbi:MAG: molecular chaperone DnaK [Planctomycetota bacterium]|jgi:molecular chaperone DnaK (HSP70)
MMPVSPSAAKPSPAFFLNGEPMVGFDLGTTFSKAAFIDTTFMPRLIPVGAPGATGDDRFQMPSVGVLRSDKLLVGDQLPSPFDDDDIPIRLPKRFLADPRPRFPEDRPRFSAAEVCAQILKRLKARTEAYLKTTLKRVVLTIPPSFGSRQRQALLQAAEWAELEVLDLVEEPVAAAVYDWMVERTVRPGDNRVPLGVKYATIRAGKSSMLVFDLGGGTLDISLLKVDGMNVEVMESWAGGEFLGGADFTQSIADWVAREIRGRTGFDPIYHLAARDKILQAAESIKRELTDKQETSRHWKQRGFKLEISRQTYEGIVEPLLSRAQTAIYQAAKSAEKQLNEPVKHLLVVGAGSRAHGVRGMIDALDSRRVGGREFPQDGSFWVALGAATMAWLAHQNVNGAEGAERSRSNHRIFQLRRRTGLNLGITAWDPERNDYAMRVLLRANTPLPAEKTVTFGKVKSHQPTVRLKVVESPTSSLAEAKSVGEFVVETEKGQEDLNELKLHSETTLEQDPDREAQIKVTLAYDITGQVKVTVLDRRTARKSSRILEPEPVDVEVSEESVAAETMNRSPAFATPEDEVKRMRRQLQELKAELERVSSQAAAPSPVAQRVRSEAQPVTSSQPVTPMTSPKPQPVIQKPQTAKPEPASLQQLDLDVDIFEMDDSRPIQTLFDDDSVVLDALSGAHAPVRPGSPVSSNPAPAKQTPVDQQTRDFQISGDDDDEDDLDLIEDDEDDLKDLSIISPQQPVSLDLGVNLRMNDPRLVGLQYAMKLILMDLMKQPRWTWEVFSALCQSNHTQPKPVFDRINQWSGQKYGKPILIQENESLIVHRDMLS